MPWSKNELLAFPPSGYMVFKFDRDPHTYVWKPGAAWGALAAKPLAEARRVIPTKAEEDSAAATGLRTKVSFTLMLQGAFSLRDRTGLGQHNAHAVMGLRAGSLP